MSDDQIKRAMAFTSKYLREALKPFEGQPLTSEAIQKMRDLTEKVVLDACRDASGYHRRAEFDIHAEAGENDTIRVTITATNGPARSYLLYLNEAFPDAFPLSYPRPRGETIILSTHTGDRTMEKNGNTFVPGDKVITSTGPFDRNGKIAAQRGTGEVKGQITDDGRMKVAWQDGTETFEKPEDLSRG